LRYLTTARLCSGCELGGLIEPGLRERKSFT
jgi:hypothetical protein